MTATEHLDYQWPSCTSCSRDLWQAEIDRYLCRLCETSAGKHLAELSLLFNEINSTEALKQGARRPDSGGSSGGAASPAPLRVGPLSLAAVGGVATRLAAIEDAWRTALGWTVAPWRGSPRQAVPQHINFLRNNLPWAAGAYESVHQDVEELRRLVAECTGALSAEPQPGPVKVGLCPCPDATGLACRKQLTATVAKLKVSCRGCGATWEGREEMEQLRLAQLRVEQAALAGVAPVAVAADHVVIRADVSVRGMPFTVTSSVPRSVWEHPPGRAAAEAELQARLGRLIAEYLQPTVTVVVDTDPALQALLDVAEQIAAADA